MRRQPLLAGLMLALVLGLVPGMAIAEDAASDAAAGDNAATVVESNDQATTGENNAEPEDAVADQAAAVEEQQPVATEEKQAAVSESVVAANEQEGAELKALSDGEYTATFIPVDDRAITLTAGIDVTSESNNVGGSLIFKEGDKVEVTSSDGTTIVYEYGEIGDGEDTYLGWKDAENVQEADVYCTLDDDDSEWWTEGSHTLNMVLSTEDEGYELSTEVTVVPNPVTAIKYQPVKGLELVYGADGDESDEGDGSFFKYVPYAQSGDTFTVTEDGEATAYVYDSEESAYIAEGHAPIDRWDLDWTSDQSFENQWELGNTYAFTIKYMGQQYEVPVTIVSNPVTAIEYKAANDFKLMERVDGGEDTAWDSESGESLSWFCYDAPTPKADDTLIVTANGVTTQYVYDDHDCVFVSEDGEAIDDSKFKWSSNQSFENQWEPGNAYAFTLTYMGQQCEVPVTIVANPVAGIELELVGGSHKVYSLESEDGATIFDPEFEIGDKLTVTDAEGHEVVYTYTWVNDDETYTYGRGIFVSADNESIDPDDFSCMYSTDDEPYLKIDYMGSTATVPLEVIESNVESISFEKTEDPIEFQIPDGLEPKVDDDGTEYYEPDTFFVPFVDGDKLTVDGTVYTFGMVTVAEGVERQMFSSGDSYISPNVVSAYYGGDEYRLVAGKTYTFTVEYLGKTCDGFTVKCVKDDEPQVVSLEGATVTAAGATYTGKALEPAVKVMLDGTEVPASGYDVTYKDNVNAGTATVTVTGKGEYAGSASAKFTIAKANNPLTAKAKTVKAKAKKVKKKAQKVAATRAIAVSGAQGKVTYKLTKVTAKKKLAKQAKKKIKMAANGQITLKKGLKKGTYKLTVQVSAAGNASYNAASKTVTVKIKVK